MLGALVQQQCRMQQQHHQLLCIPYENFRKMLMLHLHSFVLLLPHKCRHPHSPQQLLRSGNVQLPAQLQQLSQQQRLQGQQQQQHDETQSLDSAVAAGVGSHASSTAPSRRAVHDQHPRSAAAPAAASAAGAGKGSHGGAAWKNLNKLLGAHHVPPELVQEIGLARVSCLVTLDSACCF